uniref:Myb-like domain-containing protein n=1 Tax=Romanomermis culicivorax TaxID=13658 RepID=A0A915JRN3_ROMCU
MDYPDLSNLVARSKQLANESAAGISRIKNEYELLPPFALSASLPAVASDDFDSDEIITSGIGDDDFTIDEIEKMILEIKDNPLPDGNYSAIVVNQAIRDLLKGMTKKLDAFEIRQRDKERHIEQLLAKIKLAFGRQKPVFSKVKAVQYIPPYFHDASNLCPPLNEDAIHKIRNTPNFNILCDVARPFSKKEDEELKTAVSQILNDRLPKPGISQQKSPSTVLTSSHWSEIAAVYMGSGRTATECQCYYNNFLNPEINKDQKWTQAELDELKRLCSQENPRSTFCQIAESLKGEGEKQIVTCVSSPHRRYFNTSRPVGKGEYKKLGYEETKDHEENRNYLAYL